MDRDTLLRRAVSEKYSEPAHNPALRGLRSKVKQVVLVEGVVSVAGSKVRGESTEDLDVVIINPEELLGVIRAAVEESLGDVDAKVSDGRGEDRLPLWDLALVPHRPLGLVREGGYGSGNFGHKGAPGVGGSSPGGHHMLGLPPGPSDEIREAVDRRVDEQIQKVAQEEDVTTEEVEEECQQFLETYTEESTLVVEVPENVLEQILEDERIKNQHETGTSGGWFDPEGRKGIEAKAFGLDENVKPSGLPIYGYLDHPKFNSDVNYGGVRVELTGTAKARSTFTVGDSFEHFQVNWATANPSIRPAKGSMDGHVRGIWDMAKGKRKDVPGDYIEAQIHGGVSLVDIARVIVPADSSYLGTTLDDWGITWDIAE